MTERKRKILTVLVAAGVALGTGAISWNLGGPSWGLLTVAIAGLGALACHSLTAPVARRLAASEARAQAILETAVEAIITIDDRGYIEAFNCSAERIFGYTADEIIGENVRTLMPSPYRDEHDQYLQHYLTTGEKKIIGIGREIVGLRKNGTTFPMDLAVSEVRVDKKRFFTGIVRDISARKQSEAAIRESEERYRSVVETVGVVFLSLAPDYTILEWNGEAERVFGVSRDEALGKHYLDSFLPDHARRTVASEIDQVLCGTSSRGSEMIVRSRDGRERTLLWNCTHLPPANGRPTGIIACGQDITEYKALQSELQQKESLSRVGEMAAVVAHEIKNPLAAISGAIQIVGQQLPPDSSHAAVVTEILSRIEGLSNTVNDLLFFARPQAPTLRSLPIRSLLEDTIQLFRQDPSCGSVEVELEGEETLVLGDAELLKRVFVNFLVNSAQAMEHAGGVSVRLECSEKTCMVEVVDEGPGIPENTLDRVFEPFFTTKSRGSGLGLPTAQRIIEAHGGKLEIDCPGSGGTRVRVLLARTGNAAQR